MCGMLRTSLPGLQSMAIPHVIRTCSMLRIGLLDSRCAVLQGHLPAAPGRLGSRHRTRRALQEAPLQARRPATLATSPLGMPAWCTYRSMCCLTVLQSP